MASDASRADDSNSNNSSESGPPKIALNSGAGDKLGTKMAAVMQSAVRLPTPEPVDETLEANPRKRSPSSRSPSPHRRAPALRDRSPPPNGPLPRDVDRFRAVERARQLEMRQKEDEEQSKPLTEVEKQAAAKAEYEKLLTMRSGGTYIPPARLRALQAQITDKTSKEYQRMAWEALKKSINGLINKVNVSNIKYIVPELFNENLVRGRGLFCRSIMKAQAASLPFTPIYAAMAAIVNTKLPQVGELLVNRLIIQFRKAFKRNDKAVCASSTTFLAQLINQQVCHEMLAAQILLLLLHKPTDDSVEIAVGLTKEVGQHIEEMNSQIALAVYDQFRSILHEADIDKRVQYMIEVLFQIRKDRYKDNPAVKEELDLVEEEDQITHRPGLDDQLEVQDGLNIFKFDPEYEGNEDAYKKLKAEILGEASGSDDEEDEDAENESSSEDEEEEKDRAIEIKDQSNTDLVNLRRTIYLTIMSSGAYEEACHKLMRINLPAGKEEELPSMIIECCSQERTYNKFFGLIGERFCKLNRLWTDLFEAAFMKYYDTIHRYETNRLRIIAQFFGHLMSSHAIGWHVLNVIHLNEEETTSSSRIFIKILFDELAQGIGNKKLQERLREDSLQPALAGVFPTDNPKNTRFSINFFTAIGMGALTEGMREWLKNMPKPAAPAPPPREASPSERSESRSSYSSYSSYSSRSESPEPRSRRAVGNRGRSYTRSPTPPRRSVKREEADDRSPPRRRGGRELSNSRSPAPRRRGRSYSYTPSPPPRRTRRDTYSDVSVSRSPLRRRRHSDPVSASPPPHRANGKAPARSAASKGRRDSYSDASVSRSPPRRRRYSDSLSRSPPPKRANGKAHTFSRSTSPPPKRNGSTRDRPAPNRRNTSSPESSRSPPPKRNGSTRDRPAPNRRRNTSSPESSRSPPPKRTSRRISRSPNPVAPAPKVEAKKEKQDDLADIHPSRRGLMGGPPAGRARASDFI